MVTANRWIAKPINIRNEDLAQVLDSGQKIKNLELTHCPKLTADVTRTLQAMRLEHLRLVSNDWVTDDVIKRLTDHDSSLKSIEIVDCNNVSIEARQWLVTKSKVNFDEAACKSEESKMEKKSAELNFRYPNAQEDFEHGPQSVTIRPAPVSDEQRMADFDRILGL